MNKIQTEELENILAIMSLVHPTLSLEEIEECSLFCDTKEDIDTQCCMREIDEEGLINQF